VQHSREEFRGTPCPSPLRLLNDRLNLARPRKSMAEGIANGAEYASARLVPRHGGARQPDWGIAVRLPMGSTGRCVHSESSPGFARNDPAFARRRALGREDARLANRVGEKAGLRGSEQLINSPAPSSGSLSGIPSTP